ncbi:MAG: NrsF family protein [Holophagae bacterium]
MNPNSMPEPLRRTVADNLVPVRPLPPAWIRTLQATALAVTGFAAIIVLFSRSVRPDMDQLPMWIGWGSTALQLAVGVVLIGLALREAVPGQQVSQRVVVSFIGLGFIMQVVVGIATWMNSPGMVAPEGKMAALGVGCAVNDLALAAPAMAVTLWLVFRALPLRPSVAGLLGGAGAAVTADALTHVLCPMSDLRHVLVWHTGAMVVLMLLGWAIGRAWELATQSLD